MVLLGIAISLQPVASLFLCCGLSLSVDVAELKETEVLVAAVGIVLYAFQATEQQRLAHHIEVAAEGIHNAYKAGVSRLSRFSWRLIVCCFGQRIVQYFIESLTHQLLGHEVCQFVLTVFVALDDKRAFQLCGYLHIVISVNAQDVLNHVAGALHVDAIGRNLKHHAVGILGEHLHLERLADGLYRFHGNGLAYEAVYIVVLQRHLGVLHLHRILVANLHRHLASGQLLA